MCCVIPVVDLTVDVVGSDDDVDGVDPHAANEPTASDMHTRVRPTKSPAFQVLRTLVG